MFTSADLHAAPAMTLFHVTPARNVASVLRSGLRATGSYEGRPVVWLCDVHSLPWTLGHVARWKDREPTSMRILSVACEPGTVVRVRPGTHLSWRDVPPDRIVLTRLHTRLVLDSVIRFIMSRMERGEGLAEATERARRTDAFAGLPTDVFPQAARFARRLSSGIRRADLAP
jgi:hypothetical protein